MCLLRQQLNMEHWNVGALNVEQTNCKLNIGIDVLQKIRGLLQEKTLKSKNNAFLRLYVEYDILVWGTARKTNLEKKNSKTRNRSSRTILFKEKYDIVKPFYKYLSILPLKQNIKLQQEKFMWELNSLNPPNCLLNKLS